MAQQQILSPQHVTEMEILMMPIADVSARLSSLAENCLLISFEPQSTEHKEYDASVGVTLSGYMLEISEPSTGNPSFNPTGSDFSQVQSHAAWVVEAVAKRRMLLYRLTECLMELFPNTPECGVQGTTSMGTIADTCEIPITTVSRLIDGKKLLTDAGMFPYASFIKK